VKADRERPAGVEMGLALCKWAQWATSITCCIADDRMKVRIICQYQEPVFVLVLVGVSWFWWESVPTLIAHLSVGTIGLGIMQGLGINSNCSLFQ
jgi:hypothetical protein